ncbi:MAG: hypothetical protein V4635_15655 [Bacteroidota bacterium]
MNNAVLTDTGYWIGLLDSTDAFHEESNTVSELILEAPIILPWPCLYETIRTRMARKRDRLLIFEQIIRRNNIELLPDDKYRDTALEQVFYLNRVGKTYSLADMVIRQMLMDVNINVRYLVTFNEADFKDLCDIRSIEILG